jgi:hypothetical protein
MRNILTGLVIVAIVAFVWISTPFAAESVLTAKIDSVELRKDKNGADYVRILISEPKEMGGVKYQKTMPVVAFRENVDAAKKLKAGDTLKAVVSHSELPDGRESYRIIALDSTAIAKKK